jgi:hypothetical protein
MYAVISAAFIMLLCSSVLEASESGNLIESKRSSQQHMLQLQETTCPCHKCADRIFSPKQHPYTDKEKVLADVLQSSSLNIRSYKRFPLLQLVLEYYWGEEEQEWVYMHSISGRLFLSLTYYHEQDLSVAHVNQTVDGKTRSECLVPKMAQLDRQNIKKLVNYFNVIDSTENCVLQSLCKRYVIDMCRFNSFFNITRKYSLNGLKRTQEFMEPSRLDLLKSTIDAYWRKFNK